MTGTVHFSELPCSDSEHKIGVATLDNAAALNALTLDMLQLLKDKFEQWQDDENIVCILLEGQGEKAFCAGGDVRTMHDVMRDRTPDETKEYCTRFFSVEYECDYLLHTYYKPIIAWGEGIVMGGGMGIYMGSSHKVVTPSSKIAMPEISIGLYPDVGGTWFLNRLDEGVGLFLGLTGAVVNATDAIGTHLADHLVLAEHKSTLIEQLQVAEWESVEDAYEVVTEILESLSEEVIDGIPEPQMLPFMTPIQEASKGDSLLQIVDSIFAIEGGSQWIETAKTNLRTGSPISAYICYRQVTDYHHISLADCFRLELSLSVRCALLGEFQEGVRARLVDKDGSPKWKFANIAQVDIAVIDNLFESLWSEDEHPLSQLGHY